MCLALVLFILFFMFKQCVEDLWLVFVHQMFRIISLFDAVCSVDRAQMSGMGVAFIKALSCLSLQRTGSSVNWVVTALSPFFCIYSWMFVIVNLHPFLKTCFLHFKVLMPSFSYCHVCLFFILSFLIPEKKNN